MEELPGNTLIRDIYRWRMFPVLRQSGGMQQFNRASFSHTDFGTLLADNQDTFTNIATASFGGSTATHSIANNDIIVETVGQYGAVSVFVSRIRTTGDTGATNSTDMGCFLSS